MSRKYQIFISSSFVDLKEARRELIMATLQEGHIPFGMELLKPGFRRSLNVIEEKIADSDIFVVLIGARLGSPTDETSDSLAFTEQEYEYALKYDLPIIAFMLRDADFKSERDKIQSEDKERQKEDDLRSFRDRVKKVNGGSRIVGYFKYDDLSKLSEEYSRAVASSIAYLGRNGQKGGWIKGEEYDKLSNRIHLDTSVSNNIFFRDLAHRLNRFERLSKRTTVAAELKTAAAAYFWRRYFARLHDKDINAIFFESGSSIAYVSHEFISQVQLQSDWFFEQRMNEKIRIHTNNVLTYLDFLFQRSPWRPIDVRLYPYGPFSDDYGGTYGMLNFAVQEAAPSPKDSLRTELPFHAQELVDNVTNELQKEYISKGLVLMTASGVDTRDDSEDVPYPGPHVGSYPNTLLKRSLLSLSCPKVIFLHPEKWGFDFRYNNCHSVCDRSFTWAEAKSASPMALVMAAESPGNQTKLADSLSEQGFTDIDLEEPLAGSPGPWSIIAANPKFSEFFRKD